MTPTPAAARLALVPEPLDGHAHRELLDALGEGVVRFDGDGRVVFANRAAREILSAAEDPLRGLVAQALAGEAAGPGVSMPIARRDGGERWITVTCSPLGPVVHGRSQGAHVTLTDITEHRRLAASLDHARALLEERTRELERSNAALGQFASTASHELTGNLSVVCGFAELLEDGYADRLDATGRGHLESLRGGAQRMASLVGDLLALARAESAPPAWELVDLEAVMSRALAVLGPSIARAEAVLVIADLPTVETDPGRIEQVLVNLVGNALRFRRGPGVRIEVSAQRDADGWRVSVADDGIGVDPADRDRIFGMFERHADRDRYDGTGIGLALCERIVDGHGGRIWVQPRRHGDGSVFAFTIPDRPPPVRPI